MNSMKKHKTYKGKYTPKFPKKYKGNYKNIADDMDTLESILNTAGKL